ncbi:MULTISPECIES: IclR family transcriptional regulator [Microbacterium]|uniref:IclR family transcriptional regulator n=1 Tax=Microbacterium wangchenii TaxID=2541726 RepID=A0ABX5SXH2_9MICO|nr:MULTISPECIES: IclR family transcriptional regulator [Microbacterium]MCK6066211.1 IclR family transcriptional regulator [Microbacterium sp. EYE_512]QBR90482.1 IclR family transcriptional regulator [Microbacterium wangchenii]TFV84710.1 IclR family transcriptional regulator [Microbacterium sp. dk485]TXK14508.1 IclR family transcriptional regulator [Microbacterium wangchenii]
MARESAGESVLRRHMRVLESFDAWHPFLTLSEIAEASGLAVSTAHRLVAALEGEGLLERLPDRTYRLGVRLWEFASRTPGAVGLREIARPWLGAVHERVREHAQVGVLSGRDVLYIDRVSTRDAVVNATLVGGRIPLHASSSGLVLLAHADATLVDDVIAHGLRTYTERTIRSGPELRAHLRKVRDEGFAVTDGHIHPESRGIAVAVTGPGGSVYAAIGVVVPNDGVSPHPYVELLRRAAVGITHDLAVAYRPDVDERTHGIRSLVRGSRRSIEYLESLDADPHDAPLPGCSRHDDRPADAAVVTSPRGAASPGPCR